MAEDQKLLEKNYSPVQLICCTAARQFKDGDTVFGGLGISFLAVAIAKLVYLGKLEPAGFTGNKTWRMV